LPRADVWWQALTSDTTLSRDHRTILIELAL